MGNVRFVIYIQLYRIYTANKNCDKKFLSNSLLLLRGEGGRRKCEKTLLLFFIRIVQFSEKIEYNILGKNFFDSKLTRPKLFQTERT